MSEIQPPPPTVRDAKSAAKQLRETLLKAGETISHAQALERTAQQWGFRDWNNLNAALKSNSPDEWDAGMRVSGHYLSQPFTGVILNVQQAEIGWHHVTIQFDSPVDVVPFDSFSNHRSRIRCLIGPKGETRERTSDGLPQLRLQRLP